MVKNLPANAGDVGSILGWEDSPGEGNGNPHQYYFLGNPMNKRSLVGYSPWVYRRVAQDLATIYLTTLFLYYLLFCFQGI